ncbi:Enhancer of polycomb-like protein 1 [Tulasnella sp. 403]|nr:Enhancer of polycomb-like protein 1 [Tulasnella sp. 403]
MGRGDAAAATTKGTPRIRNKITHKTRLRIVHGDVVDADRPFTEEDSTDGKALATGVDAEDANEVHLLAVLAASQQAASSSTFCQQQPNSSRKSALAPPAPPQPAPHIPTPDATGKVANYAEYYPDIAWEPPVLLAKASDTLEECQVDVLGSGYAYVLDERDADWLERSNKAANGEGTSAAGAASAPRARSAKARGKEPETVALVVISEDEFELVMGLFERITDDKFPFLHLTPSELPPLSDYEAFFSSPIPPHFFASYVAPRFVPSPATLLRYARTIYPHWRERKLERGGRRIIPQLNYDESNDSDPYVCFRRREVKPLRKTRRQDTTSLDRLLKLQDELHKVLSMSKMVLEREEMKLELTNEMRNVCEKRIKVVDVKRRGGPILSGVNDDELFVDRSMARRKDRMDAASSTIRIRKRDFDSVAPIAFTAPPGIISPAELHQNALAKLNELQKNIERDAARKKDPQWEDVTENAYQPLSVPLAHRHFRTIPLSSPPNSERSPPASPFSITSSASGSRTPGLSSSLQGSQRSGRSAVAMRMRVGRGGRMLVDRRMPISRHPLDRPTPMPPSSKDPTQTGFLSRPMRQPSLSSASSESTASALTSASGTSEGSGDEQRELAWKIDERWKYDADAGVPIGGAGLGDVIGEAEDTRLIVDDFEHNTFLIRKNLLIEEDFAKLLRTDEEVLQRATDYYAQRKMEERIRAEDAMDHAQAMRREMAARAATQPTPAASNTPVPTPTPSNSQVPLPVVASASPTPVGASAATPSSPAVSNVSVAAATAAQLKKLQVHTKQQLQATQIQGAGNARIPHLLSTNATSLQQQASPTSAGSASGSGSNLANGTPGTPSLNGLGVNGVNLPNGLSGKPTPPSSQVSFTPSIVPQGSGGQPLHSSQSPNPHDVNGMSPALPSSQSPETRPKSQQSQTPIQANGVPVQVSMPVSQSTMNAGYLQANGMLANIANGFNVNGGMLPGSPSVTLRAGNVPGQISMNGANGLSPSIGLNGLTSQQTLGLKSVFASVNQQQVNGMSPQQQTATHPSYPAVGGLVNGITNGNVGLSMNGLNGMIMQTNGANAVHAAQNLGLALGSASGQLKLTSQRVMQWTSTKDAGAAAALQRQQQTGSPIPGASAMSPANGQRLGMNVSGRGSPHLQAGSLAGRASPASMNGMMHAPNGASPSPRITPQMPHTPSPLASHQQAVGGQAHMNGF